MNTLAQGDRAPDFTLPSDKGTDFTLSAQRGHPVVLFFYPEDDTEGCTTENLEFTALAPKFAERGARVVGISPDSVAKHCKFRDKYKLGVDLLSDPDHRAIGAYGVWQAKQMYGREYEGVVRLTFVIDGAGNIAQILKATRIAGHAQKALDAVDALSASGV